MSKRFWLILVGIIIVFAVIFKLTTKNTPATNSTSGNNSPTQHIEGQGKDGVTLIEYGDYQCPYCGEYYSSVKQVTSTYSQQIYFQFRNLPLTQLHPNAYAAARAAEAASLQGKFWQMHDALYENQNSWVSLGDPTGYFDQLAQQIGLNVTQFKSDSAGDQVNNAINADLNAFNKTGLQMATPTFILDGKFIQPGPSLSSFASFIDPEIAKKTGKQSTTPAPTNSTGNQSVQNNTTNSTSNSTY